MLKGVSIPKELKKDGKGSREWAADLIKEKVGVKCRIVNCRESEAVIIVSGKLVKC